MSKNNKKNKKINNIGTGMHTVSYLDQISIKEPFTPPTLQQIVENRDKHVKLIPRSKEDQEYIDKLSSLVVDVSDFIKYKRYVEFLHDDEVKYQEKNKNIPTTLTDRLNLLCGCHNCSAAFPLKNLKFIKKKRINPSEQGMFKYNNYYKHMPSFSDNLHWSLVEGYLDIETNTISHEVLDFIKKESESTSVSSTDEDNFPQSEYDKLYPVCAKFPICPSSWSEFDLRLFPNPYDLNMHKKGEYIF